MADHMNPLPWLGDLAEMFEEGVRTGGLPAIDPVLCRAFSEGLRDIGETLSALLTLAEANGLAERVPVAPAPRTRAERARLAALAAPLDPEGRVVALPFVTVRQAPPLGAA